MKAVRLLSTAASARAFTLMESMLLVVILGTVGAAAGTSMISLVKDPPGNNIDLMIETAMESAMEGLVADTYLAAAGTWPTSMALATTNTTLTLGPSGNTKTYTLTTTVTGVAPSGYADNGHLRQVQLQINGFTLTRLIGN